MADSLENNVKDILQLNLAACNADTSEAKVDALELMRADVRGLSVPQLIGLNDTVAKVHTEMLGRVPRATLPEVSLLESHGEIFGVTVKQPTDSSGEKSCANYVQYRVPTPSSPLS
jgi:hypothetical protein